MAGPLAPQLEYTIMSALMAREIGPEAIVRKTLSLTGQKIHQAIEKLVTEKGDWDEPGVTLLATEVYGLDKSRLNEYIAHVKKSSTPSAAVIHDMLQDRNTLLNLSNEISKQLAEGNLDVTKLQTYFSAKGHFNNTLTTVSEDLEKGVPTPPSGPELKSLPGLSSKTNGVYGVYIVAGVPNIGKSTLAEQFTADIARVQPVLVYDIENGRNVLLYRLAQSWGLDAAKKIGKRIYVREGLNTLSRDLAAVKPPATILIDSIQKINSRGHDDRRAGLDDWIHHFEELKRRGYNVILVSEINRANYSGDPKLDCFKETGALEYAADSALVLTEVEQGGMLRMHLIKNRHYPEKGQVGLLDRDKDKGYWFREVSEGWGDYGVN